MIKGGIKITSFILDWYDTGNRHGKGPGSTGKWAYIILSL